MGQIHAHNQGDTWKKVTCVLLPAKKLEKNGLDPKDPYSRIIGIIESAFNTNKVHGLEREA